MTSEAKSMHGWAGACCPPGPPVIGGGWLLISLAFDVDWYDY